MNAHGSDRAIAAAVEVLLRRAGVRYEKERVIGSARPDFLVTTERGQQIVIEAKAGDGSPAATARALNHAQRYKELSRAAASLVVTSIPTSISHTAAVGLSPVGTFLDVLTNLTNSLAKTRSRSAPQPVRAAPKKTIFASMPFDFKYDDTFLVAIEPAALASGAIAERIDHSATSGPLVPQIKMRIKAARALIADLSGSRPNVLHEIGYAEALRKPIIQICSTDLRDMPFNVRDNRTVSYVIGQTTKLRRALEAELRRHV